MRSHRTRSTAPTTALAEIGSVAVLVAGLTACAGPSSRHDIALPAAATSGPSTSAASATTRVGGSTFTIELPGGVVWSPDGDRRISSGARITRWRYQPPGRSPACVVTTGELPGYGGAFPAAALAAFAGTRESGVEVVRNEAVVPPPAGTVAAVRQEQSVVNVLAAGAGTTRGHLYAQQVLTTAHTLVAVYAAAPDAAAAGCRPQDITTSLLVVSPTGGSSSSPGGTP